MLRSIHILPVIGFVTSITVVAPAQNTNPAGNCGWDAKIVAIKEQDCPPSVMAKLAVPLVAGVPVMMYTKDPAPAARLPALKVAVSPTTPVELMLWATYEPPFPPVYGTLKLTPLAGVPEVSVPV